MDNANYEPRLLRRLLESPVLAQERFTVVDIGCSGGLDPLWRLFGDRLEAFGFDPQQSECARLRAAETNPHVHYVGTRVGLPKDHAFHQERLRIEPMRPRYHGQPWNRFSSTAAFTRDDSVPKQSQSLGEDLTTDVISIDAFAESKGVASIDFVKIDTDGFDLEAAMSCEASIRERGILGFMIESQFTGSWHETENSFHNIDRYMRRQGFALFTLSTNRYSRRDLPAPFLYRIAAQTRSGQVVWGDAVYLRDAAAPGYAEFFGAELPLPKVLKLLALFELFSVPDCAAELLRTERERLAGVLDVDGALDLLTPQGGNRPRLHRDLLRAFEDDIESFFPPLPVPPPPEPTGLRRLVVRACERLAARLRSGAS